MLLKEMENKSIVLSGVLARGLGEGTFFLSMSHYKKEIRKKLGFNAYPGTMNLKIGKKQTDFLKDVVPIKIKGFKKGNKILGGANCYRAKIKNIYGSIIVPELTKHKKNIIEFIAPVHLKSELQLKDGDKIKIELI